MGLQLVTHFLDLELQLDLLIKLARFGYKPAPVLGLNVRSFLVIGFFNGFFMPCQGGYVEVRLDLDLRLSILLRVKSFRPKKERFDLFVENRHLLDYRVLREGKLTLCGVAWGSLGGFNELSTRLIAYRHLRYTAVLC